MRPSPHRLLVTPLYRRQLSPSSSFTITSRHHHRLAGASLAHPSSAISRPRHRPSPAAPLSVSSPDNHPFTTTQTPRLRAAMTSATLGPAPVSGPVLKKPVKLACVQLAAGPDKAANLRHAADQVARAARSGARIVVLPECFNSPYGTGHFPGYAETLLPSPPSRESAPSWHALSAMAAENDVYLVGGSIPEREPPAPGSAAASSGGGSSGGGSSSSSETTNKPRYYNTSLVFGPDGALLATHRKVHLFDIDIPGKISFHESDVLSPGNKVSLVDLPDYGRIGLAICYDVRFPELAAIAARHGAFALVYPGAFNLTTGPLHWSLLARARAVDNQLYVAMCSPARDMAADYHAWGHSMVVDPMAGVLAEADADETIIEAELDGAKIAEARKNIPLETQRRFDVYPDVSRGDVHFEDPDLGESE